MPLPLLPFAIKGGIMLVKAIVASKKAGVVAKMTTIAVHQYGAATVFSSVAFVATTVGGVAWTADRFEDVKDMYCLWEQGDNEGLFRKFGSFLSKLNTLRISPKSAVDAIHAIMTHHGLEKSLDVVAFTKNLYDLADEAKKTLQTT